MSVFHCMFWGAIFSYLWPFLLTCFRRRRITELPGQRPVHTRCSDRQQGRRRLAGEKQLVWSYDASSCNSWKLVQNSKYIRVPSLIILASLTFKDWWRNKIGSFNWREACLRGESSKTAKNAQYWPELSKIRDWKNHKADVGGRRDLSHLIFDECREPCFWLHLALSQVAKAALTSFFRFSRLVCHSNTTCWEL